MKYTMAAAAIALMLLPASPVLAQAVDVPTATTTQVSYGLRLKGSAGIPDGWG
jgi:uncharacterized membrane protein